MLHLYMEFCRVDGAEILWNGYCIEKERDTYDIKDTYLTLNWKEKNKADQTVNICCFLTYVNMCWNSEHMLIFFNQEMLSATEYFWARPGIVVVLKNRAALKTNSTSYLIPLLYTYLLIEESPKVWIYILEVIPSATRLSNINEYSTQADFKISKSLLLQNYSEAAKQLLQKNNYCQRPSIHFKKLPPQRTRKRRAPCRQSVMTIKSYSVVIRG